MHQVIVWDNQGTRSEVSVPHLAAALTRAKAYRTMDNRTVKVADAHGSTHHWSRSLRVTKNHWTARAVADIACD